MSNCLPNTICSVTRSFGYYLFQFHLLLHMHDDLMVEQKLYDHSENDLNFFKNEERRNMNMDECGASNKCCCLLIYAKTRNDI